MSENDEEKQEEIDASTEKQIKGLVDVDMERKKEIYDELAEE